jgi:hypothetical protein
VKQATDEGLKANPAQPLFVGIQSRLATAQSDLANQVDQLTASQDLVEIKALEDADLVKVEGVPAYAKRGDLYQAGSKLGDTKWFNRDRLVGFKGDVLEDYLNKQVAVAKKSADNYPGEMQPKVVNTCNYLLDRGAFAQRQAYETAYMEEARKSIGGEAFPLVAEVTGQALSSVAELKRAGASLKLVAEDLLSPAMKGASFKEWNTFTNRVLHMAGVAKAVVGGAEDGPMMCTVSLCKLEDPPNAKDDWRNKGIWRNAKLSSETDPGKLASTATLEDEPMGQLPASQAFSLTLFKIDEATDKSVYKTEPWGPLWVLAKYKGLPSKGDLTTWVVDWPVESPLATGAIRLKFKFDRPFAGWDTWPKD